MLFRIILYSLIFYLIYRVIKSLFNISVSPKKENKEKEQVFNKDKKKSTIDKKDVIDAEFEEIKDNENEKEKSNN